MRFTITFAIMLSTCSSSVAETAGELKGTGYKSVWKGYAPIRKCVPDDNRIEAGRYVFVCDKNSYAYPYHYGESEILSYTFEYQGRPATLSYICPLPEGACIRGEIERR